MGNAAIYFHPDGFDTSRPNLLGRHSAGESFLRGFLRHGDVDTFHFWNMSKNSAADLMPLIEHIHPPARPVRWIGRKERAGLRDPGVMFLPGPDLAQEAWLRRLHGSNAYSLCGITHTTATERAMALIPNYILAPAEEHDAVICTSSAVRRSVETQLDGVRDYLKDNFGPRRRPEPQRVTIPLGVNADDYAARPEHRQAWRERLAIPEDAVVALYLGRFNPWEKMNPALMAIALEKTAEKTGKPIYWINAGWAATDEALEKYHAQVRALCPSIHYREVDGRPLDTRFSIWSAADFFISFSDNIQETFGLTPIEAMAAGLPCVVTDWDGYKDTVRHGEDGFRVPTFAPAPGEGRDLGYWFEANWTGYVGYVGIASQLVAIDYNLATAFLARLVEDAGLRRKLGENARRRAREVFDWQAIIPQYQALWGEQTARRLATAPNPLPRDNPFRPDPFTLFGAYPTAHLAGDWIVAVSPGMTFEAASARLTGPLAEPLGLNRVKLADLEQIMEWLGRRGPATVATLMSAIPEHQRSGVQRSLLWVARFGVLDLHPPL